MALPNEQQLTFNQYVNAQSMFAAIKARFGENEATKRTQKALLKQQYENFNASSSESLDSIFYRLQKLVSKLAILGVVTSPEDLNVKFLRGLPSEWDTHVVVWMNKPDFDTIGLDDLYNNFKIVEQKLVAEFSMHHPKVNTASTETSTASFSDATVYAFLSTQPQGFELVHEDLEQLHDDDLEEMDLKWNMALLSMRARKFYQRTGRMIIIDGSTLKKQYDDLLVKLDDTGFKASTYKRGLSILEGKILKYKESEVLFSEEIALLKRSVGHKEYLMGLLRTELEKVKEEKEGFEFKIAKFEKSSKDLDQLLASQITDKSKKGFGYNAVPSPHPLILNRPTPLDLSYSGLQEFKQPEVNEYGPRDSSVMPTTGCDKESDNSKENTDDSLKQQQKTDSSSVKSPLKVSDDEDDVEPIPKVEKKTVIPTATKKEFVKPETPVRRSVSCPNVHKHMVPRAVLMKTGLKTVNNARPVNTVRSVNTARPFSTARDFNTVRPSYTAHPKSTVHCARPRTHFQNQAQSTVQRPFYKRTTLTKRSHNQNVNTGRQTVNTGRQNVNTVRARGFNAVKPSACWVWKPIKPNGASLVFNKYNYIDARGRSKSMLKAHVAGNIAIFRFSRPLHGGYVTFGFGGASWRQDNMYSFDMKNIVPKDCLTCLVVKATSEESMLWHRRLEVVSTACYVQNRVLIVKPHNKTPYELFRGIKPAIGFMKPFGCHVTILNTLDKLGKFDGKSDEENKPMIEGNGPKWLFDLDSLTQSMNYVPVVAGTFSNDFAGIQGVSESSTSSQQDQDWIAMPIWKDASYFGDASPNIVDDAQIEDKDELHDEDNATEESHDGSNLQKNGTADQQVNTARQEVNTGSREVSTALPKVNTATPEDLVGPSSASEDSHMEDQEYELGNIPQSYEVPTTPHTRIHKDHPIEHVIGDVQSSVQTRRMKTSYSEKGFLSAIYEGKSHQDLHTCLFVCFLSQEEPKRISQALRDPAWVEAMQEELLQFKLQKVWILVDLPKGHRAIGTKWVYRNKKDERGIIIRNKARLVAQGHTQEEGIDYDEVFAPMARIEAIRISLAYASYIGFMVYQMDVKSAFLYGQIEEEVYVCQPPGFEDPNHPDKVYKIQQKQNGIFISQDKYVYEILKKFNYSDVKSTSTPTDLEIYIMFAVCACARFQVSPKSSHLLAIKRIFRYLKGKPSLGLWYSKDSPLELVAYIDSDYARATQDRKSTTGGC
ncbi:putative ribonuclease H-like domain-containing protein [Tanacetum coccineum]